MRTEETINDLKALLNDEVYLHGGEFVHRKIIHKKIQEINAAISKDYALQRHVIPFILGMYEDHRDHVLQYLIEYFRPSLFKLKLITIKEMELPLWDGLFNIDEVYIRYKRFLVTYLKPNLTVRIAEIIPVEIDYKTGHEFLRLIHKIVVKQARDVDAKPDEIESIILNLMIARSISISINEKHLFYFIVSIFIDGLHFREEFQFPKDLAEECLIASYQDSIPEYGYYISFRVFGWSGSSVTAFHYANVAIQIMLNRKEIFDFLLKSFYLEGIKLMRNLLLLPLAIEIFENRPTNIKYSDYDLNRIYHAYFSCLIYGREKKAVSNILTFLDSRKEYIISTGEIEALPWLTLLFNVLKIYKEPDYDGIQLNHYLDLFKRIVSQDKYQTYYNVLFGDYDSLKDDLMYSLEKLSATRNPSDFVTDNGVALKRSHRLLKLSHEQTKVEGYLLAMILQSDFSLVFKEKQTNLFVRPQESLTVGKFGDIYLTPEIIISFIKKIGAFNILWLGTDKHSLMPLLYQDDKFKFEQPLIKELHKSHGFLKKHSSFLAHNAVIKKMEFNFAKTEIDYELEESEVFKLCEVCEIDIIPTAPLLIIKDIEISDIPHNLLRNKIDFYSKIVPVCNIMSIEWLYAQKEMVNITIKSTSIYIPIESGDFTIGILHNQMEELILQKRITQCNSIVPSHPLSSDINIIVAHGASNIHTNSALFLNGIEEKIAITNLNEIAGPGKILILFVCHSGSEKNDLFSNQVLTLVKDFIQKGYQAVVAPFWALNIDIPPIWLTSFLEEFESGNDINTSVFKANKAVAAKFKTPKAYACLHLYGNPFLKQNAFLK